MLTGSHDGPYLLAGKLLDNSNEQKCFGEGGPDPREVGGEGVQGGLWTVCATWDCGQRVPRRGDVALQNLVVSGSRCCPVLPPPPRNPQQNLRPEPPPPSSPEPGDHHLKLEGAITAPKETPFLVLCFLFNFPTNTLFYHPKP